MANDNKNNNFHLRNFYSNIMQQNALLYSYQFIVEFIGLENYGITNSTDSSQNITYYVQSSTIPGCELVNGKTTFLGTEFRIPGVKKFDHNWQTKILLDENLFAYKALQEWRRDISRLEIDGGGQKVIPNVQARVSLLSTDHQSKTTSFILEGVWIKSLDDISLQYAANGGENNVTINANFKYQYVYEDPNFNMDTDPLKS